MLRTSKQETPEKPHRATQSLTVVKPREEDVSDRFKLLQDPSAKIPHMEHLGAEANVMKVATAHQAREDESQSIGVASSSICKSL